MFTKSRHIIVGFIDFFHKPVERWIPTQTFRYLACGGSNTVLNWLLYHFSFLAFLHSPFLSQYIHVVGDKNYVNIFGFFYITVEVVAYIIAFAISFPIGFVLSRHIVFPESNLHGKVQFFRYALATASLILVTYLLIKFFAFALPMVRADISYRFIMVITAILSYISQRFFTFKTTEEIRLEAEEEAMAE